MGQLEADISKAFASIKERNYGAAIRQLSKIANEHPESAKAWDLLAIAYVHTGRTHEGIESFENAIKADPKNYIAYREKGKLHMMKKEYGKAKDSLENALKSASPDDKKGRIDILVLLGHAYEKLGDVDSSKKCFQNAYRIDPRIMVDEMQELFEKVYLKSQSSPEEKIALQERLNRLREKLSQ